MPKFTHRRGRYVYGIVVVNDQRLLLLADRSWCSSSYFDTKEGKSWLYYDLVVLNLSYIDCERLSTGSGDLYDLYPRNIFPPRQSDDPIHAANKRGGARSPS